MPIKAIKSLIKSKMKIRKLKSQIKLAQAANKMLRSGGARNVAQSRTLMAAQEGARKRRKAARRKKKKK